MNFHVIFKLEFTKLDFYFKIYRENMQETVFEFVIYL